MALENSIENVLFRGGRQKRKPWQREAEGGRPWQGDTWGGRAEDGDTAVRSRGSSSSGSTVGSAVQGAAKVRVWVLGAR